MKVRKFAYKFDVVGNNVVGKFAFISISLVVVLFHEIYFSYAQKKIIAILYGRLHI